MKYLYRISCVLIALMFVSVSCFAALGPGESKDASDAAVLSAQSGDEKSTDVDYIPIYVPVSEGSNDYYEVRLHFGKMPGSNIDATKGGVNKLEPFTYYAHEELGGLTIQHYSGQYVYISTLALFGAGGTVSLVDVLVSAISGLSIPVAGTVAVFILSIGISALSELYPNGMIIVVADRIHLTQTITIPLPSITVLDVYSQ